MICYSLSLQVLSGDRYGFRPIPTEISVEEFQILKSEAAKLKLEKRELLEEWYKLEENAIPPLYVLQVRAVLTRPGGYATFFMLNSTEHKIYFNCS